MVQSLTRITDEQIAELAEWMPYFDADRLLLNNLQNFKCRIPPVVLDLTFYNLWSWDMRQMVQDLVPELQDVALGRRPKRWNCVWLSKLSMPDFERCYCELIFFGNKAPEPDLVRLRKVILDLMYRHEELTGYNIVGMPYESPIDQWVRSFGRVNGPFAIQECGEIVPS